MNMSVLRSVKAGQWITYSGKITTIRDASALKLRTQNKLALDLDGRIIMYAAPTNSQEVVIGPTTSSRMDDGLELLLKNGVVATIGKGARSKKAIELIKSYKAPYFVLASGVSAYLSGFFKGKRVIAFGELGPEAMFELSASGLLLLTAIDSSGRSVFN